MKINFDNLYFTARNFDILGLERIQTQINGYFKGLYQLPRMKTTIYNSKEPLEFMVLEKIIHNY